MDWISLTHEEQLDEISRQSLNHPVAIFKHSTRCGISAMAKKRLESEWDLEPTQLPLYYLDLLKHRNISNKIAENFDVEHESPQLLVISKGECVYHASHSSINIDHVKKTLKNS
jgi:bacillithiol system protein YtxJ